MTLFFTDELPDGPLITLEAMLEAREQRAGRQRGMREAYRCAIVSFTLNIAGPIKRFALADRAFEAGRAEIARQLERYGWAPVAESGIDRPTGLEALWAVEAAPLPLKRSMAAIEAGHPLGRLFDIDVIEPGGDQLSRRQAGLPERGCLVCGKPGAGCARSRAHPAEEVIKHSLAIMRGYFGDRLAGRAANCAVRALLHEACISPKPGLVDRFNSGAHRDMDIFTFMDSASALSGYFRDITLAGLISAQTPAEALLPQLRYPGMLAEDAMLAATGGVNTHKGLIFSLGIVCAALGQAHALGGPPDIDALLEHCARIAAPALDDLNRPGSAATRGEALNMKYGVTGVRGEAAAGFPAARRWGLPVLKRRLAQGASLNDAGVAALLNLMARVNDTNIIGRSDMNTLQYLQAELKERLKDDTQASGGLIALASELDERLTAANISPGGCADLLSITLALHFMELEGLIANILTSKARQSP